MAFKQRSSGLPFKEMGSSPAKQSYPSSAQTGPHGPTGTLDEVKKIRKAKNTKILDAVTNEKSNVKKQLDKIRKTSKSVKPPNVVIDIVGKGSKAKDLLKTAGRAAGRLAIPIALYQGAKDIFKGYKKTNPEIKKGGRMMPGKI